MKYKSPFKTLFLDIGGVLLTNGWDHHARRSAAEKFDIDPEELNDRHQLTFDTYEEGKISLAQYLDRVVFFKERRFTPERFRAFMFDQSKPFPQMIELVQTLKARYKLKIVAISNEGRELTEHRIKRFELDAFIDAFISSCFVHFRKPDEDIFRLAMDTSQTPPDKAIYIDDRSMFVQVAESLGIHSILHYDGERTRRRLEELGLTAL